MKRKHVNAAILFVACAAGLFPLILAGDLEPPGAPAPTMKTLVEVEPRIAINDTNTPGDANSTFRIAQSGSYYLTGNVVGVAGMHGIEIAASNVSVDLMGFTLQGAGGGVGDGISNDGDLDNIHIVNGIVTGWAEQGIDLGDAASDGTGSLIEQVLSSDNGGIGIRVNDSGVVRACTVVSNGDDGIVAHDNGVVESCVARGNGGAGIDVGTGSAVRGSTSRNNGGNGITAAAAAIIENVSTRENGVYGILTNTDAIVSDSLASDNDLIGIRVDRRSVVSGCNASRNDDGGIMVTNSALVVRNLAADNDLSGDGAGIRVIGTGARIEDNLVWNNTRGIDVDNQDNIIIRNMARQNTVNYDIESGNVVGTIVAAPSSGAINGSTGGAGVGTTDPWANFSF